MERHDHETPTTSTPSLLKITSTKDRLGRFSTRRLTRGGTGDGRYGEMSCELSAPKFLVDPPHALDERGSVERADVGRVAFSPAHEERNDKAR